MQPVLEPSSLCQAGSGRTRTSCAGQCRPACIIATMNGGKSASPPQPLSSLQVHLVLPFICLAQSSFHWPSLTLGCAGGVTSEQAARAELSTVSDTSAQRAALVVSPRCVLDSAFSVPSRRSSDSSMHSQR